MGRLDEGEIMRHLGGDIATNVIRQEALKDGQNQRFDFRGKAVSESQPMIRIRKNKYKKRKMAPRRVRMLRRRLVKKNPAGGKRNSQKKVMRKQKINFAQNPQNNEHKMLKDKTTEDDFDEETPKNRVHTHVDSVQQQSQNQIHRFDDSLKQEIRNKISRFEDSKQQIQPQNRFHDLMQEITLEQPSFSSHTPMTVLMNKQTEFPTKRIQLKSSPTRPVQRSRQRETTTEELLQDNDRIDWLQNKIFNSTATRNDITEVFKEEPRVRVVHDQPRIRLPRPNDNLKALIPIKRTLRKGSKHRIFTPNFSILAPKLTSNEQPIAQRFASNEQPTSSRFAINESKTAQRFASNEQSTAPRFASNEQSTASRFANKEQTTAPRFASKEQTTAPRFTSSGKTTFQRVASNEQTKVTRLASNEQMTATKFASNEQPRAPMLASNEQTTAPRYVSNEQPITLNEAFQQRSGTVQRIHSNVQVSSQPFGLKMKNRKYMETDKIREKDESITKERDISNNIKEQEETTFKEGRAIEVNTPGKQLKNVKYVNSNKMREDSIKIREEISNEIRKMLEKAKVTSGTQDNISSCITYYLTCKTSTKNKGQCLKEFNSCSGAKILLPDLYDNVIN